MHTLSILQQPANATTVQPAAAPAASTFDVTTAEVSRSTIHNDKRIPDELPLQDREYYSVVKKGIKFVIPTRYKVIDTVGNGAYGSVVSAFDKKTQERVAIKKITSAFSHGVEFAKRILREIRILKYLRQCDNVISLKALVLPKNGYSTFNDVYIVTELMDESLKSYLSRQTTLSDQHIQYLLYQMLCAIKFLHTSNVLHRDIKPHNILINYNCELKLCDFGLARGIEVSHDPEGNMSTHYVASRWYRAPELLLCSKVCNKAIDVWSAGCVFAEMLNADAPSDAIRVMFPGESYLKQIDLILGVLGSPDETDIKGSPKAKSYVQSQPKKSRVDLKARFPKASDLALDLLNKMLSFNPDKRISIDEALKHPYLESIAGDEDETDNGDDEQVDDVQADHEMQFEMDICKEEAPTASLVLDVPPDATLEQIRKMIYDEIVAFNLEEHHQHKQEACVQL